MTEPQSEYGGIVTRGLAFAIDAAVLNLIAAAIGGLVALVVSVFGRLPDDVHPLTVLVSGAAWMVWTALYFSSFWMLTGQTPGMRFMGVAVELPEGGLIGRGRSLQRLLGMVLAALPLMAGYVLILFDDRRRGFHDRFAGTVVRYRVTERHTRRRSPAPPTSRARLGPRPGPRPPSP